MKIFVFLAGMTNMLATCTLVNFKPEPETNTDTYLNTMQMIQKYGYPAEAHTVTTIDGYLLTMHRIPHGKQPAQEDPNSNRVRKPPILMEHGILGSSGDFVMLASKTSLAFLLADLGYDVWLGNFRGNKYSRGHTFLFPNTSDFWNFTWHESAIKDVPAQIDFICNYTKQEKLVYMGFSMGTTVFFALMSTLPQYNDKIEVAMLMAPIAFAKNMKSILMRFLTVLSGKLKYLIENIDHGEFLPSSKLLRTLTKVFCERNEIERKLCMNAIFVIVGSDPQEFDKDLLPVLTNNYPTGYSAKGVIHYAQLVKSGSFQQYDYGQKGNIIEYGYPIPPSYNLSLVRAPTYFYVGNNDYLATIEDANRSARDLPSLKKFHVIEYQNFSHLDFIFSVDAKELLYDTLINDMSTFLNQESGIY